VVAQIECGAWRPPPRRNGFGDDQAVVLPVWLRHLTLDGEVPLEQNEHGTSVLFPVFDMGPGELDAYPRRSDDDESPGSGRVFPSLAFRAFTSVAPLKKHWFLVHHPDQATPR
jgi:hypothetical protein